MKKVFYVRNQIEINQVHNELKKYLMIQIVAGDKISFRYKVIPGGFSSVQMYFCGCRKRLLLENFKRTECHVEKKNMAGPSIDKVLSRILYKMNRCLKICTIKDIL